MTSSQVPDRATIRLGSHLIDLHLRAGAIDDLPDVLGACRIDRPFVVLDAVLRDRLGLRLERLLARLDAPVAEIQAQETGKTLARVALLAERAGHATGVVAVGGGTIGNLAGALAHVLGFGRPLIHVPSTTVAMIDAAISGRHGLNTAAGKNSVGVWHPPVAVLADPVLLDSLPLPAWRDGAIEAVKAALIAGGPDARHHAKALTALRRPIPDTALLTRLLRAAIELKTRLLEMDPLEAGQALALHYGHTLAQALEARSSYTIRHGPAVAAGMRMAGRVAAALGLLTAGQHHDHDAYVVAACRSASVHPRDVDALVDAMAHDPKRRHVTGERIPLILPAGLGTPHIPAGATVPVTAADRRVVTQALAELANNGH